MSEGQYTATTGGMFNTQNAQSESTYSIKKYFESKDWFFGVLLPHSHVIDQHRRAGEVGRDRSAPVPAHGEVEDHERRTTRHMAG